MLKITITEIRNEYVVMFVGGRIRAKKTEKLVKGKEAEEGERVTANYIGKGMVEVTAKDHGIIAVELYKIPFFFNIDESRRRVSEVTNNFCLNGINVEKYEVYNAICKATRGLWRPHIVAM